MSSMKRSLRTISWNRGEERSYTSLSASPPLPISTRIRSAGGRKSGVSLPWIWSATIAEIHAAISTNPTTTLRTNRRPRRVLATAGSAWIDSPTCVMLSPSLPTPAPTSGTLSVRSPSLLTLSPSVSSPLPSFSMPPLRASVIRLLRLGRPPVPGSLAIA
jgi:hypothetical protein